MKYQLNIETDTGWAHVDVVEETSLQDFVSILINVWQVPEYISATRVIWNFSNCETTFFFDDIVGLKDFIVQTKQGRGPTTFALVAENDREFGMCRSFQMMGSLAGFDINVFRSEEPAREWLSSLDSLPVSQ